MASKILVDELAPQSHATDVTLATGKKIAGANTQFKITGGSNLNHLQTDGAGNVSWVAPPAAGKLLQVLQPAAITSNTLSTTSTAFVDIAGLTQSITPSATTSRILVLFNCMIGSNAGWHAHVRIMRDSTAIGIGDAYGSRKQSTSESSAGAASMCQPVPGMFIDSPSTTSATTYKLQWATEASGTIYLNRAHTNTDNLNFGTFISTLTVMEIGV
jgi:hypothetical protein